MKINNVVTTVTSLEPNQKTLTLNGTTIRGPERNETFENVLGLI